MPFEGVYLASQSPRRSQLLDQLGVVHTLLLPSPEEDAESLEAHHEGEQPVHYVQRVTQLKMDAALARWQRQAAELHDWPVVCADTTVVLGDEIFGKPANDADAARILRALSAQTHTVHTCVVVAWRGRRLAELSTSAITFDALSDAQIDNYIQSGEPFGKAGAYAVQGRAAAFIARIEGSYTGIMGLPLYETAKLLQQLRA